MRGPLAIVGYMGSGKSTVGSILARELSWKFVDLDEAIVAREGRSIPRIFEQSGEDYFREVESRELLCVLDGDANCVVACGGGVVLPPENRRRLERVPTVFLEEDIETLYARTRDPNRPLRSASREEFERRYSERLPYYLEVADLRVNVQGDTPAEIAKEIMSWSRG